jgi:hypothetical protein
MAINNNGNNYRRIQEIRDAVKDEQDIIVFDFESSSATLAKMFLVGRPGAGRAYDIPVTHPDSIVKSLRELLFI